jgi:ribose 5-phosphate isomerase RpiB
VRIAVITEISTVSRNANVLQALADRGHEVMNIGMSGEVGEPELTYIHTGLLAGLVLNAGVADLVIGGCSTGQGFQISAAQYPDVFCGHILGPLDAWLFPQINGGNCISLALNQGYGWGADVNLLMIFDALFSVEVGRGYPAHRAVSERESRERLAVVSHTAHRSMGDIVRGLPDTIVRPALLFPGVRDRLSTQVVTNPDLAAALTERYAALPGLSHRRSLKS